MTRLVWILSILFGIAVVALSSAFRLQTQEYKARTVILPSVPSYPESQSRHEDCEKWYLPLAQMKVYSNPGHSVMVQWGSSRFFVSDAESLATAYMACREHERR